MAITERPFRGEADMAAVVELRRAIAAANPQSMAVSETELRGEYLQPFPGWRLKHTIWADGDQVMGLLDMHASELPDTEDVVYLDIRVQPEMIDSPLGEAMITRGEELAREWHGAKTEVEISSYRDSTWAVELLERLGYRAARVFERMACDATDAHGAVHVPEGYILRPLAGVDEVDAWNALYNTAFRDHYDFHAITRELRLRDMKQPSHVLDLDLVAVAPDGSLAAFCWITCRMPDDGEIEWHVELVGTDRSHRRRGLAEALIRHGFEGIRERGGRRVFLEVDSTSETGANRLYERLGFQVETVMIDFRKRLG